MNDASNQPMLQSLQQNLQQIQRQILRIRQTQNSVFVAIDGRCAAGKTTLAAELAAGCLDCTVVHLDDFFLRPEQRTQERLRQPGGNVDYERFLSEVLLPLRRGDSTVIYRAYDCRTQTLKKSVILPRTAVLIAEGAYSCHPALRRYYDLRIFLTVSPAEQMRRIQQRNGADAARFRDCWIPLEERYLSDCAVRQACELVYTTD